MADEITVENTTPGRRVLRNTEVKPGETKTLSNDEDIEAAELFINRGDLSVVEGEENVDAESPDDPEDEDDDRDEQALKGIDSESIVRDLPYLEEAQQDKLIERYDNAYELVEGLDLEELDDFDGIGEEYAKDILESVQEQV